MKKKIFKFLFFILTLIIIVPMTSCTKFKVNQSFNDELLKEIHAVDMPLYSYDYCASNKEGSTIYFNATHTQYENYLKAFCNYFVTLEDAYYFGIIKQNGLIAEMFPNYVRYPLEKGIEKEKKISFVYSLTNKLNDNYYLIDPIKISFRRLDKAKKYRSFKYNTVMEIYHYSASVKDYSFYENVLNEFSFSLTWGIYGACCYDSTTKVLINETHASNVQDYTTSLTLNKEQLQIVYNALNSIKIESYPDVYEPSEIFSEPSLYLTLSVSYQNHSKTITCYNAPYDNKGKDDKAQEFIDVCNIIIKVITETDEWKALPESQMLYE